MAPTEIAVWAAGALGLAGVAWAFFKSNSLAVRLGALGVFGVFYITVLALGWGGTEWFNATTIAVVLIALLSGMKAPLAPKSAAANQPSASAQPTDAPAPASDIVDDPEPPPTTEPSESHKR